MKLAAAIFATTVACALGALPPAPPPGDKDGPPSPPESKPAPPTATAAATTGSCAAARDKSDAELRALQAQPNMAIDGWYTPQCDDDGSWSAEQRSDTAWGSSTWCVDKATGKEVAGTALPPGMERDVPCGAQADALPPAPMPGSCEDKVASAKKELKELRDSGAIVDAYYIPECEKDGSWARQQCMVGMVTSCWCVDPADGAEEPNTRLHGAEAWSRPVPCGAVA